MYGVCTVYVRCTVYLSLEHYSMCIILDEYICLSSIILDVYVCVSSIYRV